MKHIKSYKIFEITNYDKLYYSDMSDEYDGNLFIHSINPLTLNDIKENPKLKVRLFNRADASDIDSEYIYKIKTKKPLYKKERLEYDWNFLDLDNSDTEKKEIDNSKYSGYFSKDSMTSDLYGLVDTSDIIEFRFIGGFKKYDKEQIDIKNIEISEETDSFLYSYISGTILHKPLTDKIDKELEQFRPDKPLKIYKGIEEVQIRYTSEKQAPYKNGDIITSDFPHLTSWTRNPLIGRRFIDDYPSSTPFLVEMIAQPKDILVDVQMLPIEYYHTNQREIMMRPGIYTYKIIWTGKI